MMKFLGLEVGTWADWFGALGTILAVAIALYQTYISRILKYDLTVFRVSKRNHSGHLVGFLKFTYTNKNEMPMEIQMYGLYIFRHKFSCKSIEDIQLRHFKEKEKILEPYKMDTCEEDFYNIDFNGRLKTISGNVYIVPYLLDSTGEFKKSRKKYKFKLSEIDNDIKSFI